MKRTPYLLTALAILFFVSCTKELSLEQQQIPEPPPPPPVVDTVKYTIEGKYQLKDFYSDIPIDYNENDTIVKQETDLWSYASDYLKDDINDFDVNSSDVTIEQMAMKKPGLNDEFIHATYTVGVDDNGAYIKFLNNEYKPLTYRISEIGKNFFILAFPWKNGSTLYSRFERL